MFNRYTAAIVLTAMSCTAASQAFGSTSNQPTPTASAASLSAEVSSLSRRVRTLERRANALSVLEQRHISTSTYQLPLIPQAGTDFQTGTANCVGPDEVPVGGGIGYPTTGPHAKSVIIESQPFGSGWYGVVYSPDHDDAHVYVVCASLG